jgi:DNA-binding CsgD family transcriptional regulator
LSAREAEILRLVARGLSNQEIADSLFLSIRTVERHVTNAYGKIGAHNRAAATAYVLKHLV